ncbi:MAG: hypothetical protein K1X50_00645 [Candidatus Promineofilum sp.]|nr:hypothetical protein [Promineifilum sp.]MCW5863662.1 hypothetical protein [Anaerolineae bacterium]
MTYQLPFVSRVRPRVAQRRPAGTPIGPADIVIVGDDGMRVCHIETSCGPLVDGPAPLSFCYDAGRDKTNQPVNGLNVTQVGGVVMLRVE